MAVVSAPLEVEVAELLELELADREEVVCDGAAVELAVADVVL